MFVETALCAGPGAVLVAVVTAPRATAPLGREYSSTFGAVATASGTRAGARRRARLAVGGRVGIKGKLKRVGIKGKLKRTLESTNPCESMLDCVHTTPAQRQALVLRRDGAALDRRRDARSREAVPQGDWLHPAPRSRDRDRTTTLPAPAHPQSGGCRRSHYVTITPGPPSPKFHVGRGNLARGRASLRRLRRKESLGEKATPSIPGKPTRDPEQNGHASAGDAERQTFSSSGWGARRTAGHYPTIDPDRHESVDRAARRRRPVDVQSGREPKEPSADRNPSRGGNSPPRSPCLGLAVQTGLWLWAPSRRHGAGEQLPVGHGRTHARAVILGAPAHRRFLHPRRPRLRAGCQGRSKPRHPDLPSRVGDILPRLALEPGGALLLGAGRRGEQRLVVGGSRTGRDPRSMSELMDLPPCTARCAFRPRCRLRDTGIDRPHGRGLASELWLIDLGVDSLLVRRL
jgi:hypothetical protein